VYKKLLEVLDEESPPYVLVGRLHTLIDGTLLPERGKIDTGSNPKGGG